jgi:hypothetical protein
MAGQVGITNGKAAEHNPGLKADIVELRRALDAIAH